MQGITFLGSSKNFVLTQSYGRNSKSHLLVYKNVDLTSSKVTKITKGYTSIAAPALAEETVYYNSKLYILFESATNYFYYKPGTGQEKCKEPMNHLCTITKNKLLK